MLLERISLIIGILLLLFFYHRPEPYNGVDLVLGVLIAGFFGFYLLGGIRRGN